MKILGRGAAQNTDNVMAQHALVVKQLRRYATDGTFAERLKPRGVPGDVDRSLAAHCATLLQESLEEIERPGCALGGEYLLCKDISMIASLLNLLKLV